MSFAFSKISHFNSVICDSMAEKRDSAYHVGFLFLAPIKIHKLEPVLGSGFCFEFVCQSGNCHRWLFPCHALKYLEFEL